MGTALHALRMDKVFTFHFRTPSFHIYGLLSMIIYCHMPPQVWIHDYGGLRTHGGPVPTGPHAALLCTHKTMGTFWGADRAGGYSH